MKKSLLITFLLILSLALTSCLAVENMPEDESKESASMQIPTEEITEKPTEKPTEAPENNDGEQNEEKNDQNSNVEAFQEQIEKFVPTICEKELSAEALEYIGGIIGVSEASDDMNTAEPYKEDIFDLIVPYGDESVVRSAYSHINAGRAISIFTEFGTDTESFETAYFAAYKNIYLIDGADIDESKEDSIILIMKATTAGNQPFFRELRAASVSDQKLSLYFTVANANPIGYDDAMMSIFVLVELDKSAVGDISDVEIAFENEYFDLKITDVSTNDSRVISHMAESAYHYAPFNSYTWLLFDNSYWVDGELSDSFDYTVEIMEKETVGLEEGSIFKPVFEYDGQVRSVHYDSQEGILVANGRSLVLNEAQKAVIDNLILK